MGYEVDGKMNGFVRGICRTFSTDVELLKEAFQVFEKTKNAEVVIYPRFYCLVIQSLCIVKEVNKAFENLEVVGVGYSQEMITYISIIEALCLEEKDEKALSVLLIMFKGGRFPPRVAYDHLIDEYNQQGKLLNSSHIYGAGIKRGVFPEKQLGTCLINEYVSREFA
ncbi:hypothetical protein RJ641_001783 [Dillenia turbinata]|uniref:Pentatricopeptide repeat-containing protein n=1 Tax=Dillenia turbinata TaxID=194707 RepID=A0AAN8Z9V6_9MAGN